jgi:hypothetical protein
MNGRYTTLFSIAVFIVSTVDSGILPCKADPTQTSNKGLLSVATVASVNERDALSSPVNGCTVLIQATGNLHRFNAATKKWEVLAKSKTVNVKDYGAVGDSHADDSPAIEAAIEAAHHDPSNTSSPCGGAYYGVVPEVLFPAGTYRITRPVVLSHYDRMRGEGNAALKADKPNQDIVVPHQGGATWRTQISGLCFLGGARAIVLNTHNLDSANIIIQRCQFNGSNVCAISAVETPNSTLLKITDCEFLACEQVLRSSCDMAVMSDCWITTRESMKNKAVFENRGVLILERILGVPLVNPKNDQRWIDNHNCVTCRTVRFGGEGAGFCAVNNLATYNRKWPVWPTSVMLEDCMIYCLGNSKRRAAIYCEEVPNIITVRNCTGLPDLPMVKLAPTINPDAYFADAVANPSLCRFLLTDNTVNETWQANSLPPLMRRFTSRPATAINAREFGAAGNGSNDDTGCLQVAMDYATAAGMPLVIPAGRYRVTKPINVTANEVRGEGKPSIVASDKTFDIFYAPCAWRMTIDAIRFQNGRDQVSLGNPNIDQGMLTVRNCEFNDCSGVAVRFRHGSNSTSAHVERCAFNGCIQVLVTWCDGTAFRDSWVTTSQAMKNMAAIENRSGNMTCEKILGVPLVNGNDQRWIDNYSTGALVCRDIRFGGEGSGFTPVVNYAKCARFLAGPKIVLDSCWVSALGNSKRPCAVYCVEVPNQIAIRHCELAGCTAVTVDKRLDLKTYFKGVRPGMLRFDVANNIGEFAGDLPEELIQAARKRHGGINYGAAQLTPAETAAAVTRAVEAVQKLPQPAPGVMKSDGPNDQPVHRQQTKASKYINLLPPKYDWDLTCLMDGTAEPNSVRLAVARVGDGMVIVKRIGADTQFGDYGCWPHVLVKDVALNLAKTPWLTWRLLDSGLNTDSYTVKVIHVESGRTVTLAEAAWAPFHDYRAYDLRKAFDLKDGTHTFQVKLYFIGTNYVASDRCLTAKKGDYLAVDFMRVEAD